MCKKSDATTPISAPPPIESVALVGVILITCISCFPRMDKIDEVATVEVISSPLFPHLISKRTLGCLRLTLASIFFSVTMYRALTKGYIMRPHYLKSTKLRAAPINLNGLRSQVMFTSWCWNLLTLSFALNGFVTLLSESNSPDTILHSIFLNRWILRFAIIIFEIAAPVSMLVSFVVRYALWPQAMKGPAGSFGLRRPAALAQHNANVLASLMEVAVLGQIPVRLSEISFAPVWGGIYIFFTWYMMHKWVKSGEPQCVYFFFDTTLGAKTHCLVIIALMSVQAVFFFLFSIMDDIVLDLGRGVLFNTLVAVFVGSITCRFRD